MKATQSYRKLSVASSTTFWLVLVAAIACVERLLVIFFYQPVPYSDTFSYRRLADSVLHGFTNYDGTRTPGYPVFLALTGTDQRAWIGQLVLGFIATLLLFFIGWKLTEKPWFGGVIALAHTFNLGQLFFESNLLTESITTFFLILTLASVLVWLRYPTCRTMLLAFILGLESGITLLIRPLYIYLPFFLLIYLWLNTRLSHRRNDQGIVEVEKTQKNPGNPFSWRFTIAFLVSAALLLGGWVTFIHAQFNEWSLTTMTGYHLVQHTGNFFEYVPDEYASLRDTYIKYRDEHIAQFGTQTNAIWDAIPEMTRVSGYSFYALSRVLAKISVQLIEHHPLLFIKSAITGWWMFWRAPVYWSADALKLTPMVPVIKVAIQIQRPLIFLFNLVFIFASLYFSLVEAIALIRHKSMPFFRRINNPTLYSFTWMLLANIWIASILQTLLDHGDNPRFLVPMQSLVVLWVGIFGFIMLKSWIKRSVKSIQT
jgi:hypothetical protein